VIVFSFKIDYEFDRKHRKFCLKDRLQHPASLVFLAHAPSIFINQKRYGALKIILSVEDNAYYHNFIGDRAYLIQDHLKRVNRNCVSANGEC